MPRIGKTAAQVPGSGIREIVNLVIERPDGVLRLEIGEPDAPTPEHIVDAAAEAARRGVGYTASAGTAALRTALAARLHRVHGLEYEPDDVIVAQGAVQGLAVAFTALLAPGDEVLIPDPAWPNYEMQALMLGAVPVHYPLRPENGFVPDPVDVAARYTPRTRVLVLNTPSNPTGAVFPREIVAELVAEAARRDAVVLSDEVYDELIFEGEPAVAAALDREHVVGVYSLSKTYAMTGWRVGYLAAPGWLAPTLVRLQEPMLSCISAVSQAAALAAIEGPQDCVAAMRESYRTRRDLVVELLTDAGIDVVRPAGAFYQMVPLAAGVDSRVSALDLVTHGVSVAPGTSFGDEARDQFRISLASSTTVLSRAIGRLTQWYDRTDAGRLIG
jgi:aspartate/methionine/tyrosine aminotransferase